MERLGFAEGVYVDRGRFFTLSVDPGNRVYGERLVPSGGSEYREWSPHRSKLSAYLSNGGREFPFRRDSAVLYLGASSGTTPSHISDIVPDGKVYCIEFAPRMFRDLVANCGRRPNMIPVLADATDPSSYRFALEHADIVYADVAQKRQADIIMDNMEEYGAKIGMVAIKARSEDVSATPGEIFRAAAARIASRGYGVKDRRSLEPFEDSHEMIVLEGDQ